MSEPASGSSTPRGRLHGRIAIVTGAASGIGRGSALAFAREGATVLCTDVDPAVQETAEEAGGSSITGDLSDPVAAEAVTRAALERHGRIDVVYACAGIAGAGTAADTDMETWNRVIAVNLTSKWLSFKFALPGMVEQGSGSVIVQASIGGLRGVPGIFPYAAAKAGCIGMARQAAIDYGPHGVRVNVIAPGNVPTPLVRRTYEAGGGMGAGLDIDEAMARIGDVYPMRRVGTVEEVAAMAVHLASDESSWTTGQVFVVDGGITSAQPGRRASSEQSGRRA